MNLIFVWPDSRSEVFAIGMAFIGYTALIIFALGLMVYYQEEIDEADRKWAAFLDRVINFFKGKK